MRTVYLAILLSVAGVNAIAADKPAAAYQEPYRPQFHFSPEKNWTNDPCGIVYFNHEYHLFFQYNPQGDHWGHMSWGHAVSSDLLHWKQLPVAIPESEDVMIFTGSSVVDRNNSSGLCKGGKPCVVSIYSGHAKVDATDARIQHQNLASSDAAGRVWTKYAGNPVLDFKLPAFRDPKVFWHTGTKRWIMVIAIPPEHKVRFYASADLKAWSQVGEFGPAGGTGGEWECPDLFQLPVDGDPSKTKWVLKIGLNPGHLYGGSGEQYFVGEFDGSAFKNENPASQVLWLDYGRDCYCALTFNGLSDDSTPRSLPMIGWMNNWQYADKIPTSPWRGQMTLPRRLALKTYPEGIRLEQHPIEPLREKHLQFGAGSAMELNEHLQAAGVSGQTLEIKSFIQPGKATEVGWKLLSGPQGQTIVGYDVNSRQVFVNRINSGDTGFSKDFPGRYSAPLPLPADGRLELHILVDRSSVEVYAGGGRVVLTNLVFPPAGSNGVEFYATGGKLASVKLDLWNLKSTR